MLRASPATVQSEVALGVDDFHLKPAGPNFSPWGSTFFHWECIRGLTCLLRPSLFPHEKIEITKIDDTGES